MSQKKKFRLSFKHMFVFMSIILAFICISSVGYLQKRQKEDLLEYELKTSSEIMENWISGYDNSLEELETYLYEIFNQNQDIQLLLHTDILVQGFQSKNAILDTMGRVIRLNGSAQGAFLFLQDEDEPVYLSRYQDDTLSVADVRRIREDIIKLVEKGGSWNLRSMWSYHELNGFPCLVWISKINDGVCGAWINCDTYLERCSKTVALENDFHLQMKRNMSSAVLADISSGKGEDFSEKELQIKAVSRCLDASVVLTMFTDSLMSQKKIDFDYVWYVTCIFAALLLIVFTFQVLMYHPIRKLSEEVKELESTEEDDFVHEDYNTQEIFNLSKYINQLIRKLRTMKIENYETLLSEMQIEQEFLLMRHKTHFFINCISVIYALANEKNYELISKMAISLTEYLRRIDYEKKKFVSLEDELHLIHSYTRIQKIRFSDSFKFEEDVPIDLFEAQIPPLILQTFVENAVEHARVHKKNNIIQLKVGFESGDDGDWLLVDIIDNGDGFSEEFLADLKENTSVRRLSQGHGVGISNAIARLEHIYDHKAIINIQNDENGGAHIHMSLPVID